MASAKRDGMKEEKKDGRATHSWRYKQILLKLRMGRIALEREEVGLARFIEELRVMFTDTTIMDADALKWLPPDA